LGDAYRLKGEIIARKTSQIVAAEIWGLFSFVTNVDATLVIVGITADVTSVSDYTGTGLLESRIKVGDTITGVIIYDLSTPDSDPGARRGFYEHNAPPAGITLMVCGLVFMTDPENVEFSVTVDNDFCTVADCYDAFRIESRNNLPLPSGVSVGPISINFYDGSSNAFSSTALPTTAPVLEDWEIWPIDISCSLGREPVFVIGCRLTSAVLIPEPATI
jgi:hypothetical protein